MIAGVGIGMVAAVVGVLLLGGGDKSVNPEPRGKTKRPTNGAQITARNSKRSTNKTPRNSTRPTNKIERILIPKPAPNPDPKIPALNPAGDPLDIFLIEPHKGSVYLEGGQLSFRAMGYGTSDVVKVEYFKGEERVGEGGAVHGHAGHGRLRAGARDPEFA